MRSIIKDKRGVLGLETVQQVIILLLVLAVLAVASFLALDALLNSGAVTTTRIANNFGGFTNESITLSDFPNRTSSISGLLGVVYTGTIVINDSDVSIAAANYTIDTDGFFTTVTDEFNGSIINISVTSFTNTINSDSTNLVSNVTSGTAQFFENIPTIMVILGAVVIILAVVLIILAVGRISGAGRASDLDGGGGSTGPGL